MLAAWEAVNSMNLPYEPDPSLAARVAALFQSQPNTWINGMTISHVGGCYGWRTRISDCRKSFGMVIRNRQRRVRREDGSSFIVSEYMLVVEETKTAEGAAAARHTTMGAPAL